MSGVRCASTVRVWNWSQNKVFNGYVFNCSKICICQLTVHPFFSFIFEKGAFGLCGNP